jgi:LCP family protein required for cell wall assembly
MSRVVVEGLLGIDIPYYVRIDFNGFKDIIDSVGGVDVYVDNSFKDYTYPTDDYKVQTVSFTKGWQHMDGSTALKYTRSRHGTNGEGSDFARSRRQQKVIAALKDKVTSSAMIRNPAAVANTLAALRANVTTNLQIGEILRLAKMAKGVDPATVKHLVLSDAPSSPLVSGNYGGAYVLLPKNNDWGVIRDAAADLFDLAEPSNLAETEPRPADLAGTQEPTPAPTEDAGDLTAKVEIKNGTGKPGEARLFAERVAKSGFTVVKIGNADTFGYQDTVVYDLTKGTKSAALDSFKELVGAKRVLTGQPKNGATTADFVLIIGAE